MRQHIERLVTAYFGDEASELDALPLLNEPYLGQALGHVYAIAQLAGTEPDTPGFEALSAAYVFLACHYILVDNTLDGDVEADASLLQITQLIALFLTVAEAEVCDRLPVEARVAVRSRMLGRLAQRDRALRIEIERRSGWDVADDDYAAAVGRSSLSLLFYELLCALRGLEPNPAAIEALSQFLYAMQMSDDMADWRKDLLEDNHTPFLRRCAGRIGAKDPSEAELEREIYLGGYFEEVAADLAVRFEAIEKAFRELGGEVSALYARQSYDKTLTGLTSVVATKADFLNTVGR